MLLLVISLSGRAQTAEAPVHVAPNIPAGRNTADVSPTISSVAVKVNLVLVPVVVTDSYNRSITNLQKDNFQLLENGQQQPIKYFSREDAPISIGIVFDRSGSMNRKLRKAREAVGRFLRTSNPEDEFFIVTVSDRPAVLSEFTTSIKKLEEKLVFTPAVGHTALLDGIELAMEQMRSAHHSRKCLLIVSDGGDNRSRATESEIKSLIMESDVQLYSVGIFDDSPETSEERLGPALLTQLAEATGGRNIVVTDQKELTPVLNDIAIELHHQYVLGYYPADSRPGGQWHAITVKLIPPDRSLHVQAKKGYVTLPD